MIVRRVERRRFVEHWVTARASRDATVRRGFGELYGELAAWLAAEGVQPVAERLYGPLAERDTVAAVRERMLGAEGLDSAVPFSYLDPRPGYTSAIGGIQIWGVVPKRGDSLHLSTVEAGGGVRGRLLRTDDTELLWLCGIKAEGDRTEQAEAMFRKAREALLTFGFRYRDVVRTWIYLRHIDQWYGEFNRIRNAFHAAEGLTGAEQFPASTGVQGSSGEEECVMDLLAVRCPPQAGSEIRRVCETARQGDAFAYGSGFSRAVVLRAEAQAVALVSGTASIGRDGRTLRAGDSEGQVFETLLGLGAVLAECGARLTDVIQGTVFCRDEGIVEAYRNVTKALALEGLPLIAVIGDLCRSDLLVEAEVSAVFRVGESNLYWREA